MTQIRRNAGKPHPRQALALACVPAFMVGLDALVVTIALATIRRDLHASVAQLGWTVNAYVLSFGVLILLGAVLGDRLGRRRMFTAGLGIFTAASAACALAPSSTVLIAARAVQGAGAALISPLSLALVSAAFPPGQRGKAIGIWGAITGSAVAVGPVVGGAIVQGISWHWIFWINVPIGLAAAILSPRVFEESHGPRRPIDAPGVLLASGGLLALVWAIIRGNDSGWTSAEVLTTLLAGATLLAAFVIGQSRATSPMLPRHLFADRSFVAANAATFLLTASLFGAAFLVPQYLQSGLHHSAIATGLMLLPWTGVTMLVTPLAGALADRIGDRPLMVCGLLLQAIGFAWIGVEATPMLGYGALIAPLLLAGIGISLVFGTVANAVVGGVTADDLGIAAATNASFRQLGAPFGVAIAAAVFAHAGGFATPQAIAAGVGPALLVAGVISALGAAAALQVRARARGPMRVAAALPAS
ncbi:MAG: MFS transporter [Candidatus Dormibacteraeota bacterium]|uniref:MFS transporter n=1 Tax=Candidatus Amunia macphersoniae TaxID=3127014 RepID=A0A934N9J4_9BACT|nr:MFS transporter [Candidatus Dormibacteraeota bacterium]